MSSDPEAELIASQLRHAIDLLRSEVRTLEAEQQHQRELYESRLKALEEQAKDHETRLRAVSDGVTQFRTWTGLVNGGSSVMSLIAIIKAWFGG